MAARTPACCMLSPCFPCFVVAWLADLVCALPLLVSSPNACHIALACATSIVCCRSQYRCSCVTDLVCVCVCFSQWARSPKMRSTVQVLDIDYPVTSASICEVCPNCSASLLMYNSSIFCVSFSLAHISCCQAGFCILLRV